MQSASETSRKVGVSGKLNNVALSTPIHETSTEGTGRFLALTGAGVSGPGDLVISVFQRSMLAA